MKEFPRMIRGVALGLSLLALPLGPVSLAAQISATAGAPASAPADADWAMLPVLNAEKPAGDWMATERSRLLAVSARKQRVSAAALAFYKKYPADPRRWEAVQIFAQFQPFFIKSFTGEADLKPADVKQKAYVQDDEACQAWRAQFEPLRLALLAASDAPLELRVFADGYVLGDLLRDGDRALKADRAAGVAAWARYLAALDALAAKYPEGSMASYASDCMGRLRRVAPAEEAAALNRFARSPNESIRHYAETQQRKNLLLSDPLDLAFTAADGRAVDLAKLRGKVVLVDFWATWCAPCIAELPNVKKVYAAYQAKGFEVVGIALESGKLLPGDTPAQTAEKLAAAKQVLLDFVAKEQMPWPQQFDGKFWKNDVATKYTITSIPAMFLLDQDGRVVSTNARGPALEAEVKRLLKL